MQKQNQEKVLKSIAVILIVVFCFIAIKYLWPMFDVVKIEKLSRQSGIFGLAKN